MNARIKKALENDLFHYLMNGVLSYTAFSAIVMATIQVPPDAILDCGLQEIIMVFEGD